MEKQFTRRNLLKTGAAASIAGAAAASTLVLPKKAGAAKRWRMQTHWPAGAEYYETVYQKFAERVNTATNGELQIQALSPGTVCATKDVLDAVGRGTLQIGFVWPAYWIGKIPVASHLNGHLFTWGNFEEMWFFMTEMGALDIIREAYAEHGVYVIGPYSAGPLTLYSKKPLEKMEDFKGLKVRSTGTAADVFKKMGATPVFFPGEELYQALQTGVCDAAHWGGVAAGWEMKFQEVTNYIVQPNFAQQTLGEIIINKKEWDNLPKDIQQILLDCTLATNADCNAWYRYHDFVYMKEFQEEYDGKIVTMDEGAMQKAREYSLEVIDKYSEKDPKYCGRVGKLMHEFLEMTGKV
ncbi:MAG: TRAP transporter substrate-binding protein [Desulfosalsimonas sp.]